MSTESQASARVKSKVTLWLGFVSKHRPPVVLPCYYHKHNVEACPEDCEFAGAFDFDQSISHHFVILYFKNNKCIYNVVHSIFLQECMSLEF